MNQSIIDFLFDLVILSGLVGVVILIWILTVSMVVLFFKRIKGK